MTIMPAGPTIALVQFSITHLKPDINLQRAESFIQQASKNNANVVIFPEDFMTGSIFGDISRLDQNHNFAKKFQLLAKKYNIDIVCGSWMEQTPTGAKSTTAYIDARGTILGEYHKNHLYLSETYFLTPGTEVAVFDTKFGKAGLIICWDLMFPKIFMRMNKLGVQIVYCQSYWYKEITGKGVGLNPNAEAQHLDALCLARAVENNIVFVYTNAAGSLTYPNGDTDNLVGHSQITAPILGTVAKLTDNSEEIILQKIDLSVLDLAENIYQLRKMG